MLEDELLKLRFKAGSLDALQRIYEKYRDYLLTLAMAMVNDGGTAEDVVHDVFVAFAQSGRKFRLHGNLRSYLNGTVEMRMHEYKYELPDSRTKDMREGVKWGGGFDDKERWREWRQLKEAGPGEDLGTYEETVENRVFSFKRERYVLSDGTEIMWSVGTPKDGQ